MTRAVRIAFLLNAFPVLSETFILNQITGLLDRGCEVDLFAWKRGDLSRVHGEVVERDLLSRTIYPPELPRSWVRRAIRGTGLAARSLLRSPGPALRSLNVLRYRGRAASLSLLHTAAPFFGRNGYDVVHCHFGPNGLRAVALRELGLLSGRLVTTFYGYDVSMFLRRRGEDAYKELFREADLALSVSAHMRDRLVRLGCESRKARVHHIGVDTERFRFKPRDRAGGPVRVATVARLVEKKGIEYGIRAVARLVRAGVPIEYRIAGDGALRDSLHRLIEELGVGSHVTLLGAVTQERVLELLDAADVFLSPSVTSEDGDEEGVPTAIMEAMAMGLPILSSLHSGIPELVEDGVSGFLVPERDVEGLEDRLARMVARPEECREMGRAGRARVEASYDIRKLNDGLASLYRELIGAEGIAPPRPGPIPVR